MIIGAAVVDDILAIAVLSVVISITGSDAGIESIEITDVMITILQVLGFFAVMLIVAVISDTKSHHTKIMEGQR